MRLWRELYSVSANFFLMFGLKNTFKLDASALETNYRAIQSASHPDRFVTASNAEKLQSMQTATLANEAYLTLKSSANRAKYCLMLQNIDAVNELNTNMPADFLMQQMEWREAMEDAKKTKNIVALEQLLTEMQAEAESLQAELIDLLDEKKDYMSATDATRKLIFIDKVSADILKEIEFLD